MRTREEAKRMGGCHCVVIHTDGGLEPLKFSDGDPMEVFDKARDIIGCRWLDYVVVQDCHNGVKMAFLVNDNGYAEWGNDPQKVNQIATYLYNGGHQPGHYILGDVVVCWSIDTDEGGEFIGMSEITALGICRRMVEHISPQATKIVPVPSEVPDPVVRIMSFDSTEDLFRHMDGDTSVKPKEEVIISGGDAKAQP